jgi:hypothetical protein
MLAAGGSERAVRGFAQLHAWPGSVPQRQSADRRVLAWKRGLSSELRKAETSKDRGCGAGGRE